MRRLLLRMDAAARYRAGLTRRQRRCVGRGVAVCAVWLVVAGGASTTTFKSPAAKKSALKERQPNVNGKVPSAAAAASEPTRRGRSKRNGNLRRRSLRQLEVCRKNWRHGQGAAYWACGARGGTNQRPEIYTWHEKNGHSFPRFGCQSSGTEITYTLFHSLRTRALRVCGSSHHTSREARHAPLNHARRRRRGPATARARRE